jgi:hypothetical protein
MLLGLNPWPVAIDILPSQEHLPTHPPIATTPLRPEGRRVAIWRARCRRGIVRYSRSRSVILADSPEVEPGGRKPIGGKAATAGVDADVVDERSRDPPG